MVFCALLATLSGALFVYASHPQQRLFRAVLTVRLRMLGWMLLFIGMLAWCDASGIGAGMASSLAAMMATWVLLPYLAWWQGKATIARASRR
jgi:hypothetical protein